MLIYVQVSVMDELLHTYLVPLCKFLLIYAQVFQELLRSEQKFVPVIYELLDTYLSPLCKFMLIYAQVLQELLGNERKFVSVMDELLDTYLTPLQSTDSGLYVPSFWLLLVIPNKRRHIR